MKKLLYCFFITVFTLCITGCSTTATTAEELFSDAVQKNNITILAGNPSKGEVYDMYHNYFDSIMDIKIAKARKDKSPIFICDVSSKNINEQWTANLLDTFERFIKENNLTLRGNAGWSLEFFSQSKEEVATYNNVASIVVLVINEKMYAHLYVTEEESQKYIAQPYEQNAFFKEINVDDNTIRKNLFPSFYDPTDPKYKSVLPT